MITKIQFTTAQTEVLSNTSNTIIPNVLTLSADAIISYTPMKLLIVGLTHMLYLITGYNITLRYNAVTSIMDVLGLPQYMDLHKVINKYMIYITDNNSNYGAFILSDTLKVDKLNNTYTFTAVPMLGVISKYQSSNIQYLTLPGIYLKVPKPITINQLLVDLMILLTGDDLITIDSLQELPITVADSYATAVALIFSDNNRTYNISNLYSHSQLVGKWFIKGNTPTVAQRKHLKLTYLHQIVLNDAYTIPVLKRKDFLQISKRIIVASGITQPIFEDLNFDVTLHQSISLLYDEDGMTYYQMLDKLIQTNFFGRNIVVQIDTPLLPIALPDVGSHIIGIWPRGQQPAWITDDYVYWYHNELANRTRSMYILWFISIRDLNNSDNYNAIQVRQKINPLDPTQFIGDIEYIDVHSVYTDISNRLTDDFFANDFNNSNVMHLFTGLTNTVAVHGWSLYVLVTSPNLYINHTLLKLTLINVILLFKQLAIFKFGAVITHKGGSLYNYYGNRFVNKFITNNIDNVILSGYTPVTITDDLILSYSYLFQIQLMPLTFYKYSCLVKNLIHDRALRAYMHQVLKNYNRKMIVSLIGNYTQLDLFNNRYVYIFDKLWQIVSISFGINQTTILVMGK